MRDDDEISASYMTESEASGYQYGEEIDEECWWKRMQGNRFLADATDEQKAALKRDLEPVISIYNQL
jgi:hypothetical protein